MNNWNDEVRDILYTTYFNSSDFGDPLDIESALDQIRKATSELVIQADEPTPWVDYTDSPNYAVRHEEIETEARNQLRANQRESIK